MRYLLLILLPIVSYGQDSCAVFEVPTPAVKMMGYTPDPVSWKTVNYVIHVHYTQLIPYTDLPESVVYDADDHLNEEFEEAFFDFNLVSVEYHNFDNYEYSEQLLLTSCVPYSSFGYSAMNEYLEDIVWDREIFMNVHVFPAFCTGILGFAWTAYMENVNMDGVWVRTNVFGRDSDHLWGDRDENKTLIHEVGHYLSLHHVFRNVEFCGEDLGPCLESGDYVCDTPTTKVNWSCENPICPPGLYDYTPNNHMDYYTDSCRTNFTQGQIDRMHAMIPITRPGIVNNDADVCVGDLDGDYVVGMNDMLLMLANFGDAYWEQGDINDDGFFTVTDFQILLAQWGTVCFGAELDPFYREEQTNTLIIREVFPNAIGE